MIKISIAPIYIKPEDHAGNAGETLSGAVTIFDSHTEDIKALFDRYNQFYGRCRGSFTYKDPKTDKVIKVGWVFTHQTFVTRDDWITDMWVTLHNTTPEQNQAVFEAAPYPVE
jgi:hypothetical protein